MPRRHRLDHRRRRQVHHHIALHLLQRGIGHQRQHIVVIDHHPRLIAHRQTIAIRVLAETNLAFLSPHQRRKLAQRIGPRLSLAWKRLRRVNRDRV